MLRASVQFGRGLIGLHNLKKGERVLVVAANDVDIPVSVLGILWAGGVVSTANPAYTASELAHQISDTGAKIIIADHASLPAIQQACQNLQLTDVHVVMIGPETVHDIGQATPAISVRLSGAGNPHLSRPRIDPDDLAFLVYSSGTTGTPKGVMLSHHNFIANILQITACSARYLSTDGVSDVQQPIPGIPPSPATGDKILSILPFYHVYGLSALVMAPIVNGIHSIVVARFNITRFCQLIQQHRISFVYLVPPVALDLAKSPVVDQYNLRSVRMANSGAAPLSKGLQDAVYQRTGIRVKQGYGLSETSPTTHEQRWQDWRSKAGSIGRLFCNMQAKFCEVQDEASSVESESVPELPIGQTGELYLKGPNVFQGYWQRPEATAACLSKDGWFRTGDIGHMDADGDFYITDRAKELIKYKGFQVAPAELEGVLTQHPLVNDTAVVGVKSIALGTEIPRALVVRKGGMQAVQPGDEKAICDWIAKQVVGYKKLRGGIGFVSEIPKSKAGKILRRQLKAQAAKEFADLEAKQNIKSRL